MNELKPCPICGAKVEIDDPEAHLRNVGYHITCNPCYLQFWAFAGEKPVSLVARWNDRQKTIALLQCAESALASSYDVTEYPASDDSKQARALAAIRAELYGSAV